MLAHAQQCSGPLLGPTRARFRAEGHYGIRGVLGWRGLFLIEPASHYRGQDCSSPEIQHPPQRQKTRCRRKRSVRKVSRETCEKTDERPNLECRHRPRSKRRAKPDVKMCQENRQHKQEGDPHQWEQGIARRLEKYSSVHRRLIVRQEPCIDEIAPGVPHHSTRQTTQPDTTSIHIQSGASKRTDFTDCWGLTTPGRRKRKAAEVYTFSRRRKPVSVNSGSWCGGASVSERDPYRIPRGKCQFELRPPFSSGNSQTVFHWPFVSLRDHKGRNQGNNYYILWLRSLGTATSRSSASDSKCDK